MSVCARCGAAFTCAMANGADDAPCWCVALPALPPSAYVTRDGDPGAGACFCPACLRALLDSQRDGQPVRRSPDRDSER